MERGRWLPVTGTRRHKERSKQGAGCSPSGPFIKPRPRGRGRRPPTHRQRRAAPGLCEWSARRLSPSARGPSLRRASSPTPAPVPPLHPAARLAAPKLPQERGQPPAWKMKEKVLPPEAQDPSESVDKTTSLNRDLVKQLVNKQILEKTKDNKMSKSPFQGFNSECIFQINVGVHGQKRCLLDL
ncbi:serine/arginine repetitive matrix protein 1-like [Pongo pygmaeus]|uniref:serine/arginine repetitive matrix protein 1-like n=1 Tax=Pongo pygmaeus TaxID=9600 RepID=UPI00300D2120